MTGKAISNKIILIIIIAVQCLFITLIFANKKQGYHSDELWNYGFANSSDGAHIHHDDGEIINNNEWLSSEVLRDYITVGEDEIFDFKSVYDNAAADLNPPLQYMLLHIVSSVRPGTWSVWYCYIINLIAFVITQIYIYKILKLLIDRRAALAGMILYGFCMGACDITIFLRIYALGVAFATMFLYYALAIFKERDGVGVRAYIKLLCSIILGAFTLHQFLIYAFIVTLMICIYYFFKRAYKRMFVFGGVCLCGVLVSIMLFPTTLTHMFSYSDNYSQQHVSFIYQAQSYIYYINRDIIGIYLSMTPTFIQSMVAALIGVVFLIFLIICLICKKRRWVQNFRTGLHAFIPTLGGNIKKHGCELGLLVAVLMFLVSVCAYSTNAYAMGPYTRRYVFIVFPVFAILVIYILYIILQSLKLREGLVTGLIFGISVIFAALTMINYDGAYFFSFDDDEAALDRIESDADCIVLLKDYWIMTCATCELYDTDMFYMTSREEFEQDNYDVGIPGDSPVYLIMDVADEFVSDDEEEVAAMGLAGALIDKDRYLDYYRSLDISDRWEYIGTDYLHSRREEVYRLR